MTRLRWPLVALLVLLVGAWQPPAGAETVPPTPSPTPAGSPAASIAALPLQAMTILVAVIAAGLLQLTQRTMRAREPGMVAALQERYDLPTMSQDRGRPAKGLLGRTWRWVIVGVQLGLLLALVLGAVNGATAPGPGLALALAALAGGQAGRGWGARLRGPVGQRRPLTDVVPPWMDVLAALAGVACLLGAWLGLAAANDWRTRASVIATAVVVAGVCAALLWARGRSLSRGVSDTPPGAVEALRAEAVRAQSVALGVVPALAAALLPTLGIGTQHPSVLPGWALAVMGAGVVLALAMLAASIGGVSWYLDHAGREHRRES